MTEAPSATTAEVTVARVFDAPRELVWKMFTELERFAHYDRLAEHLARC